MSVKISSLEVENVKRVKAVKLEPSANGLTVIGGIMTVPYVAVNMNRYGIGIELNSDYFRDGVGYLKAANIQKDAPTLFDFIEGAI